MDRTILYYPTIRIPRSQLLNQTLLYWDSIASIAPKSWKPLDQEMGYRLQAPTPNWFEISEDIGNRGISSEDIKLLHEKGLIKIQNPENIAVNKHNEILTHLKAAIKRERPKKIAKDDKNLKDKFWIIRDKVSQEIARYLISQRLANEKTESDEFFEYYIFEYTTGQIYMSILARFLAEEEENTIPLTDQQKYWDISYNPIQDSPQSLSAYLLFDKILPCPDNSTSISRIISFKEKNKTDLFRLRKKIDEFEKAVANSKNRKEIDSICLSYNEDLKMGTETLKENLANEKISFGMSDIYSFIMIESPIASLPLPMELKIAAAALGGTIILGYKYVKMDSEIARKYQNSSYSYLVKAQETKLF